MVTCAAEHSFKLCYSFLRLWKHLLQYHALHRPCCCHLTLKMFYENLSYDFFFFFFGKCKCVVDSEGSGPEFLLRQ